MPDRSDLTAYVDFLCPWAYRGAMWLDQVEKAGRVRVDWRFFSLAENHRRQEATDPTPSWDGPATGPGLPAFRAAIASRAQGDAAYARFRAALQRARHEDGLPADLAETHQLAAKRAGLDMGRFTQDLQTAGLKPLAIEHTEAVARGVFGVPTLVWPQGRSYYVKLTDLLPADRSVALYDAIEAIHRFGEVVEIKTPESEGTLAA